MIDWPWGDPVGDERSAVIEQLNEMELRALSRHDGTDPKAVSARARLSREWVKQNVAPSIDSVSHDRGTDKL